MNVAILLLSLFAVYRAASSQNVEIGFDRRDYDIVDSSGSVTVSVSIQGGQLAAGENVTVYASTRDGTATSPDDYIGITNQPLVFDTSTRTRTVRITINDDDDESQERFTVVLTLGSGKRQATRIEIMRGETTVIIMPSMTVDIALAVGLAVGLPAFLVIVACGIGIGTCIYCYFKAKTK